MKNILVPINYRPSSARALLYAAQLAQKTNAKLVLLSAEGMPDLEVNTSYPLSEFINIWLETAPDGFSNYIQQNFPESLNLMIQTAYCLSEDMEAKDVLQEAERNPYDLVVMGVRNRSMMERMLGGSRVEVLIDKLDIPILAVPPNTNYKVIKQIVYATSLQTPKYILEQLKQFAQYWGVERIHFLHVIVEETRSHNKLRTAFEERVHQVFGENNYQLIELENSYIERTLDGFISIHRMDLVVMMERDKGALDKLFTNSLTKTMSCQGNIPALVFQEKKHLDVLTNVQLPSSNKKVDG